MIFQIASDLHLEFPENRQWLKENPLIPAGEILLLAGDIILEKYKNKADFFFEDIEKKFQLIITINGNHEFYSDTISYAYPKYFKQITERRFKLNNSVFILNEIRFIASTLWSNIPLENKNEYYKIMNDYRFIYNKFLNEKIPVTIEETNYYYKISVDFILNELNKTFIGKTIIMTHHIPSFDIAALSGEEALYAYSSDLTNIIKNYNIDFWIFGHIHKSFDGIIGNTRMICNPLGYIKDGKNNNFKRDFIFKL